MWKLFSDSENVYMLNLEEDGNNFTMNLTDLVYNWKKEFTSNDLVQNFKELNPLITSPEEEVRNNFLQTLENLQDNKAQVAIINQFHLDLTLRQNCHDSKRFLNEEIVYKFTLSKTHQDEFKAQITVPAIQTVYFLEKRQKMLMELLRKKDKELEEYRLEKGEISRGDLKTTKFDSDTLERGNKRLFLDLFTSEKGENFWQQFTKENGEVETVNLKVDAEPWNSRPKRRIVRSGKSAPKRGCFKS